MSRYLKSFIAMFLIVLLLAFVWIVPSSSEVERSAVTSQNYVKTAAADR